METIQLSIDNVRRRGLTLPAGVGRRGVYQLTHQDGRRYAGRTDDVIVRMGGHFRTYDDIAGIAYSPAPTGDLNSVLRELEAHPNRISRVDSAPDRTIRSSTPRTTIEDSYLARVRWIETNVAEVGVERPAEAIEQRAWTRPKFDQLASHPDFEMLRGLLRLYLERVIPAPRATERRNWVITSMPSTCRTKVWHRLICLSVNNIEALTIGQQFDGERWTVAGFMSAAQSHASTRSILPISAVRKGAFVAPAHYKTVGDVWQIGFDSLAALGPLLESDSVLDQVSALVMRLMKRGRGMYGRFHDYNLADVILD